MRLTLERFGGIAGIPAKPLIVDTAALPSAQAAQLEALAERVLHESAPQQSRGANRPDAFAYELTIEAPQARRVIGFDYAQASAALRELVSAMRAAQTP